ncbi:competence/damage-inducible protein A [Microaerobacter geothermalis]|uniref:competence/damage-inducible protein A n=1 Tax=Microaerobacter geothermalis TaxID=674972 RepID=UPI001F27E4C9|nr:competence/damage-inducible protein A [Microaerobacter geothermalis]MCF6093152.1 competence/damage-inducible protein A [Microaerobacter geothermalis]
MRAEIIAVGSELLLGQIVNTNAQFISQQLALCGIDVFFHTVVGDNQSRLLQAISVAKNRADILIFTGGLGPTKDDITKETVSLYLQIPLEIDKPSLTSIVNYFEKRGIPMTENNQKQALILKNAKVFPNEHGLAPGMALEKDGTHFILLPGPPSEMKPMFINYIIPHLNHLLGESNLICSKVLRFFGIGESALEEKLQHLLNNQSNPTIAPLANEGEVTIRITAKASNEIKAFEMINRIEDEIRLIAGEFIYGVNNETLHQVAIERLSQKKLTLSLAESCTGGLLGHLVTSVPGASSVFLGGIQSYSDQSKVSILGLSPSVLKLHGAVSEESAKEMAENTRSIFNSDIGISITGIAGPAPVEGKEVGLIYIGIANNDTDTQVYRIKLAGTRNQIKQRAAKYALFYLWKQL